MLHSDIALFVELKRSHNEALLSTRVEECRLKMLSTAFGTCSRKALRRRFRVLAYLDSLLDVPEAFHSVLVQARVADRKPLYHKMITLLREESFTNPENINFAEVLLQVVMSTFPQIYQVAKLSNKTEDDSSDEEEETDGEADDILVEQSKAFKHNGPIPMRGYKNSIWRCAVCHKCVKGDGNRRAHVITCHVTLPCVCPREGCQMTIINSYGISHHLKKVHNITKAELTQDEKVALMTVNSNTLAFTDDMLRQCFPNWAFVGQESQIRMKSEDKESRICRGCEQVVLSPQGRRNHIQNEHHPIAFRCFKRGCAYTSKGWNALRGHLKRKHRFNYRGMDPDEAKVYLELRREVATTAERMRNYFPMLTKEEMWDEDRLLESRRVNHF